MTTSASAARAATAVFKAPIQRRPLEKLGWVVSVGGILSPAPAFDDAAGQEQEEKAGCQTKNNRPGVHHPAGEVPHLARDVDAGERLAGPACLHVHGPGHV